MSSKRKLPVEKPVFVKKIASDTQNVIAIESVQPDCGRAVFANLPLTLSSDNQIMNDSDSSNLSSDEGSPKQLPLPNFKKFIMNGK